MISQHLSRNIIQLQGGLHKVVGRNHMPSVTHIWIVKLIISEADIENNKLLRYR